MALSLLETAETVDKFLAEESSYLHVGEFVERWIEMACVVGYFYQIPEVDDVLLAYTHKSIVQFEQHVAVDIAF